MFGDDRKVPSLITLPLQIILSQSRLNFEMIIFFSSFPVESIGISIESINDFYLDILKLILK